MIFEPCPWVPALPGMYRMNEAALKSPLLYLFGQRATATELR